MSIALSLVHTRLECPARINILPVLFSLSFLSVQSLQMFLLDL